MTAPNISLTSSTVPGLPVDPELSRRMKRIAGMLSRAKSERDRLILEAHDGGASLREIGELVGMSHVGVRNVINAHRGGPMDHTEGRNVPGAQE